MTRLVFIVEQKLVGIEAVASATVTLVVCKLLDLGHAGLGHAELGQRDWDMRNWDSFYSVKMGKIVVCV